MSEIGERFTAESLELPPNIDQVTDDQWREFFKENSNWLPRVFGLTEGQRQGALVEMMRIAGKATRDTKVLNQAESGSLFTMPRIVIVKTDKFEMQASPDRILISASYFGQKLQWYLDHGFNGGGILHNHPFHNELTFKGNLREDIDLGFGEETDHSIFFQRHPDQWAKVLRHEVLDHREVPLDIYDAQPWELHGLRTQERLAIDQRFRTPLQVIQHRVRAAEAVPSAA